TVREWHFLIEASDPARSEQAWGFPRVCNRTDVGWLRPIGRVFIQGSWRDRTVALTTSVIEYILGRLHQIGITDVFGVRGDFAFPIQDAIVGHPDINWIGCCNELNAGYAADGYARIRGVAALSTTYGVGELSAISAVAGSYAEHLPVFHITGMPA